MKNKILIFTYFALLSTWSMCFVKSFRLLTFLTESIRSFHSLQLKSDKDQIPFFAGLQLNT